jgi:hypothetical protein
MTDKLSGLGIRRVGDPAGKPAYSGVIVAMPQLARDIETIADLLAHHLTELEESLIGKLTIIEAGRVRQRNLPNPASVDER